MNPLRMTVWTMPVIVALVSCSREDVRTLSVFPVDGQILIAGKAAEGAIVVFEPKTDRAGSRRVEAVVRTDGHFVPAQPDGAVGLPEGEYGLMLRRPAIAGRTREETSAQEEAIGSLLVVPGVNIVPPIRLAK